MPGARTSCRWASPEVSVLGRQLTLPAARGGKKVRIWCTPTDHGRRVAREAAATLKPCLPNAGGDLLYITAVDPMEWEPVVNPFDDLVGFRQRDAALGEPGVPLLFAVAFHRIATVGIPSPRAVARTLEMWEHARHILRLDVDPPPRNRRTSTRPRTLSTKRPGCGTRAQCAVDTLVFWLGAEVA